MKIGKYELHQIETGIFGLDGGAMFGIVPRTLWSKLNTPDNENRIEMALRALLIMGGKRNILVDTGIGNKFPEKYKKMYKIDQVTYNLNSSLKKFNLEKKVLLNPSEFCKLLINHSTTPTWYLVLNDSRAESL